MTAGEWRAWLADVARDLGARLAVTVGQPYPRDPVMRGIVKDLIGLEQECARSTPTVNWRPRSTGGTSGHARIRHGMPGAR